jgi:hypothetical protein
VTWALGEVLFATVGLPVGGPAPEDLSLCVKAAWREGLRRRLRELASPRRRFGYRVNRPGSTSPGGVYLSVSALHEVVGGALSAPPT